MKLVYAFSFFLFQWAHYIYKKSCMGRLLAAHHYLALLVSTLFIIIVAYAFCIRRSGSVAIRLGKGLSLAVIAGLHTQVVLGFVLMGHFFSILQSNGILFRDIMKNSQLRYKVIEHPLMMVIAAILATLAHIKLKREGFSTKVITLFVLALLALLSRLPFDQLFS